MKFRTNLVHKFNQGKTDSAPVRICMPLYLVEQRCSRMQDVWPSLQLRADAKVAVPIASMALVEGDWEAVHIAL